MELIREISEQDINFKEYSDAEVSYKLRKASRAIVLNKEGKIALLYVSKDKYHKLPGGGIESGEDIMGALKRELLEEVGVETDVIDSIGIIIEYRDKFNQLQISYCYLAEVVGEIGETSFTEKEKSDGFILKWVKVSEAAELMERDVPQSYVGRFIRERDLTILKRYKNRQ